MAVTRPALIVAPPSYLTDLRSGLAAAGLQRAVATCDTALIFDWLMTLVPLQGISDAIAFAYTERHGSVSWAEIDAAFKEGLIAPFCAAIGILPDVATRKVPASARDRPGWRNARCPGTRCARVL